MLTYKYFVYYPKPRGGYRPITPPPPLARGIYPPLFGAPAQQRDANCINFTCLTKSPHGAILFKFPVLWLAKHNFRTTSEFTTYGSSLKGLKSVLW